MFHHLVGTIDACSQFSNAYTLDGQVVYMMHMFFSNSKLHKKGAKQFPFFRLETEYWKDVPLVMLSDPTCHLSHESLPQ